jgi:hypothetical protein
MNIYWWQGGLHIAPENEVERETLRLIWRIKKLDAYGNEIVGAEPGEPTEFVSRLQMAADPLLAESISAGTGGTVEE